jgi:recombination protein RecR
MAQTPLIDRLIDSLKYLPGIGPKSAQRIAFHLLSRDRDAAHRLADALHAAATDVRNCELCRNFSDTPRCSLCSSAKRDASVLCVVESPADVLSIQRVGSYLGQYFVLHGHLSPLDGITPAHLGLDVLKERLKGAEITEVVLATSTTPEGEATAHYISEMARVADVKASRIAYGVPLGGELEYVDGNTLALAISTRRDM